jgi:nucleotide-binding universal stress UspA family protein
MAVNKARVERILCAVAFSPSSWRVVAWAASLARANDGEVRLFHVVAASDTATAAMPDADPERVLKKMSALAQRVPDRSRISAAVAEGDATTEILRHARLVKADLIAIGMHARDGSVSPLVARLAIDAPCPILVVDEAVATPIKHGALDHIVVAVNFLPASLAAADHAFGLARNVNAHVTVVHVLPEHWQGPAKTDANVDAERQLVEHHFRQLLHITFSGASGLDRDHTEVVTSGQPCVEIVRVAANRNADLIVMGIDATPTSLHDFGETTSCVMQFAQRTVLLVPERLSRTPHGGRSG